MKWSSILKKWESGEFPQIPNNIKEPFLWRTSAINNKKDLDFKHITDSYKFIIYNSLARKLFEKERELSTYLSTSFENEVDKLRELDSKIFTNQNKQLIENLASIEITVGVSRGRASELS